MGILSLGMAKIRTWARALKGEILALWFAIRDPRTPWPARLLGALVVGYAISPIDLIPDFIPVLGYLDDVILLSLGLALVRRLIPAEVMADARVRAQQQTGSLRPRSVAAAVCVILVWIAFAAAMLSLALRPR
ncbi:MAG: YkvA family protein [Rectinemataceae bacterium]